MKISELIDQLVELKSEVGDLEIHCWNGQDPISYEPRVIKVFDTNKTYGALPTDLYGHRDDVPDRQAAFIMDPWHAGIERHIRRNRELRLFPDEYKRS